MTGQRAAGSTPSDRPEHPGRPVGHRSEPTETEPVEAEPAERSEPPGQTGHPRPTARGGRTSARKGSPKRPGRPRDEAASQAIFAAALHQLEELGYGRMTVDSVAAEAGVSRTSVYRRFRDKADLVTAAIAQQGAAPDALAPEGHAPDRLAPATPPDDPREALIAFLEAFDGRFAESCLEVIGGLIGAREDPTALALHRERVVVPRRAHARSLLEAARNRGELAPDADLDLALQMLIGSVLFRRVSGEPAGRGWARRAVETLWTGMGRRDGGDDAVGPSGVRSVRHRGRRPDRAVRPSR